MLTYSTCSTHVDVSDTLSFRINFHVDVYGKLMDVSMVWSNRPYPENT